MTVEAVDVADPEPGPDDAAEQETPVPVQVTRPGVYDLPADVYHADPVPGGSLSSTGARRLLPPGCPAIYRHERDNGRPPKNTFDFGHAAHRLVLGVGPDLHVTDVDEWRTDDVKAEVDEARAAGKVPIRPKDYEIVKAMATELWQCELASLLLAGGKPERAIFWRDREYPDVVRRTMLDWLPDPPKSGRMIVPDYKTAKKVDRESLRKDMWDYGYHRQADWALNGIETLGVAEAGEARFVFIAQMKDPPYLVEIFEPDYTAGLAAEHDNRRAVRLYAECARRGRWPGHSVTAEWLETGVWPDEPNVIPLALPGWAEAAKLKEMKDD